MTGTAILSPPQANVEGNAMPIVGVKRQITLPVEQCREAGIQPGDEYRSFVVNGRITIVRKAPGAAKGCLQHKQGDPSISDEASLLSALDGT